MRLRNGELSCAVYLWPLQNDQDYHHILLSDAVRAIFNDDDDDKYGNASHAKPVLGTLRHGGN